MTRWTLTGMLILASSSTARAGNATTDFEFTDLSGAFSIGAASFSGGQVQSIGFPELYHSGSNSWMIVPNEPGVITFDPPAINVMLFLRDQSSANMGMVTVEDTMGDIIGTFAADSFEWIEVSIRIEDGAAPVQRITVDNNGGAGFTVIDDLTFRTAEITEMPGDDMPDDEMPTDNGVDDGSMDDGGMVAVTPMACGAMSLGPLFCLPLALLMLRRRRT